jgi:hypothetical protein
LRLSAVAAGHAGKNRNPGPLRERPDLNSDTGADDLVRRRPLQAIHHVCGGPQALGYYGNIFTVTYIGLGVVVALDLAAVILGANGLRQRNRPALSGAAVGIGATGFIGLLVNLVLPLFAMPLITPHIP